MHIFSKIASEKISGQIKVNIVRLLMSYGENRVC
jgi:hypothetical protein